MTISATTQGLRPGVCTSSNRPATPFEGQMIYETDTDLTYVYGGSAWQQVAGGTAVGNSGLVYVKSQTVGSAVSSVTVTGAFSATYDNYLITMAGGTVSADTAINMQLGASTTGYYGFLTYGVSNTNTIVGAGRSNFTNFSWVGGGVSGQMCHARVEILAPFLSSYTKLLNANYQNGGNYGTMQGEHRVATSYDAFTLLPDVGTFTGGTITVYGYRK